MTMEQRDVLIAARNNQIREVLHQALVSSGYTCALASDGEKGLAEFRKTRPQLVITDLIMPVLQEHPDAAVIVVTNFVDMGEVLTTARRVLGHRQLPRRAPTVGSASRLRDPEEEWRTPEQFLDAFEHISRETSDPQFTIGLPIIRAWMNLRSRQTVSQTDLDGLLDQFAGAPDGMHLYDFAAQRCALGQEARTVGARPASLAGATLTESRIAGEPQTRGSRRNPSRPGA